MRIINIAIFFLILLSKNLHASNLLIGVRGDISRANYSFETPAAKSRLKWEHLTQKGFGVDVGIKFNDYFNIYYNFTKTSGSGSGVDDDLTNASLTNANLSTGISAFSIHDAKSNINDNKAGININLFNNDEIKLSARLGYVYKNATMRLFNGDTIDSEYGFEKNPNAMTQKSFAVFASPSIGIKIDKNLNDNNLFTFIFDYFPAVQYRAKQHWPIREPGLDSRFILKNNIKNNRGFYLHGENNFRLVGDFWFKIYTNYERIKINKLKNTMYEMNESMDGFDYVIYYPNSPKSLSLGHVKWENISGGVGFNYIF